MSEVVVTQLNTFPVKACQGISAGELKITTQGVPGDRGFMLWADGAPVDQLKTPRIAAVAVDWDDAGSLRFSHTDQGDYVHTPTTGGKLRDTKYILDEFQVIDQGDEVAEWISSAVGKAVRLVSPKDPWTVNIPLPEFSLVHARPKDRFYAATPISLANQASLDDLNSKLEAPVGMDRFRMNVVVEGLEAFREDHIVSISSGDVTLERATYCERCAIVETDQRTGTRPRSGILAALAKDRRRTEGAFGSGLIFGAYMAVTREGTLRVGDRLTITG